MKDLAIYRNTKRNEKCPCGSGRIFKKCCMKEYKEARRVKKNIKFLNEDELFDVMMQSQLSIDMISEGIYEDVRKQLKYNNVLTSEELLLGRVSIYYDKSIELLKVGEFLHSFTVILGIYELRLMELPNISKDYLDTISFEYLDLYTYKVMNRDLSIIDKQILIELLLNEYDKYESDNIFDFEHFIRMLESIIVGKDIIAYFIKNIENRLFYKLENNDYIVALKNKISN